MRMPYIMMFMFIVIAIIVGLSKKNEKKEGFSNNDKLLFFYADWCGYCSQFKPEIEKLEATNLIQIEKLNDTTTPDSMKQKYNIRGYPTVYYLCDDKNKTIQFNGERTKESLEEFVKNSRK